MKLSFKQTVSMVMGFLKISAFTDKKLTAEQAESLKAAFGEKFASKFSTAIAEQTDDEQANEDAHAEGLYEAITAHFAAATESATSTIAAQLAEAIAQNNLKDGQIALLKAESETDPFPISGQGQGWKGKEGVAKVLSVARKVAHYATVFASIALGQGTVVAGTKTIDVDNLRTEFGTFLSQNQTNVAITAQIFKGFSSASEFRTVPAVTEYQAIQSQINSVSQQFSAKWTPSGETKFTPLKIQNYRHKINVAIIPADVLDSYIFHLYDEGLAPDQMPITKYIWHSLVFPKLLEDIEYRMIFKGKYVANSTTLRPEDSMNGIEQILVDEKASGTSRINFFGQDIDWTTATDKQVVDFINAFADAVDDDLTISKIYTSKFVKKRYQRAYENLYGANNKVVGGLNQTAEVDFVNMSLHELKGMGNSPIIFATTPGNMVKLRHKNEAPNVINDVQKNGYEVRLFGEYWLGVGFEIAELVFAYVPANYNPQVGLKPSKQFPDGTQPEDDEASDGL
ncbi:hypothetical protein [Sphingobacterium sp. UGAL515B_05]|uniref:hypothetical protein n=1 Tax=Sphingobacterium sp. UGAL515B_05 TaxID=2986767 RepID=UPI002952B0D4|nr:hypothetical protein [Sphingobacterium sp. UGAL515B_05]WON93886.1 hypothetical protein OK025_21875 [Sphingobacterium sp. UGAL515B_05]